jgi:acyl-ACP thioesterase
VAALSDLLPAPAAGRVFEWRTRPGLADAAPGGRVRLDAIAGWLQDAAWHDIEDAGVSSAAVWVVRRLRMCVGRFPRFGEHATVRTACSGLGRMWAERRTSVTTDGGGSVEAVALWVHLDPEGRRPMPLSEHELALYAESAAGREVKARLRHPAPPDGAEGAAWEFRPTELDLAGHVNNTAYWAPLEAELLDGREPAALDAEIEFRAPAQPGRFEVVAAGEHRWIMGAGGDVHASIAIGR